MAQHRTSRARELSQSSADLIVADGTSPEIHALVRHARASLSLVGETPQPLQMLTTMLAGESVETLHIVAHGQDGSWFLGGQPVTLQTLRDNAHLLARWDVKRIALWICEAGEDAEMVGLLARLTSADVAVTRQRLGFDEVVGRYRWLLQDGAGRDAIHASCILDDAVLCGWRHQLSLADEPPSSSDDAITATEDTTMLLRLTDFGVYTDAEGTPLDKVKITALPGTGTLNYFNGSSWAGVSINQVIGAADIGAGKLSYTPAPDSNASATIGFQVGDGNAYSTDTYTLTVDVTPVNDAPQAVADDGIADEAGGTGNATEGSDATGNVLANDTDADTSDTATVTTTDPQVGVYGTLVLSADGSYTYYADNSNAAVQALRTASDTLSDTFTYAVQDSGGAIRTSTLTITLRGANDAPTAVNDRNIAKEKLSGSGSGGADATGNVLGNDTDPDAGDVKTVTRLVATGTAVSVSNGASTLTLSATTGIEVGDGLFAVSSGGTVMATVVSIEDGAVVLSDAASVTTGATYYFRHANGGGGFNAGNTASPTVTAESHSSLVTAGMTSGGPIVGMSVTVNGGPTTLTVTSVNTNGTFLLNGSVSVSDTLTFATDGADGTFTGKRGTLTLSSDGSYTYHVTNDSLDAGTTATEKFAYTMRDTDGLTSTATLTVTIEGTGAAAPAAANDAGSATEKGGTANDSGGSAGSGSVLGNDTGSGLAVREIWKESATPLAPSSGAYNVSTGTTSATGTTVTGNYGSIKIGSDGSYTYAVNEDSGLVQALGSGESLTDIFFYRGVNSDGSAVGKITVTVNGANDAPAGVDDANIAIEAGGAANAMPGSDAHGNVLANDGDVDTDLASLSVTPLEQDGDHGTLTLAADGSYTYTVTSELAAGATVTDMFEYTLSDGSLTDTAELTITVTGVNDAPVNTVPGTAHTQYDYETQGITGLSVADPDDNLAESGTVTLSIGAGTLSVDTVSGGSSIGNGSADDPLVLSGTAAQINAMLATLALAPDGATRSDRLKIVSTDAMGLATTDYLSVVIDPDDRDLEVDGSDVNEVSPYAMFSVAGQAGQKVALALGDAGTEADATSGSDHASSLEYHDGESWVAYAGGFVRIPGESGAATLLVRVAVLDDASNEGAETLELVASNRAGESFSGHSTISDDGTGSVWLEGNDTGEASDPGDDGYPQLDDDRAVTPGSASDSDAGSNTVAESASNGSAVGLTAAATDANDGTITYSLADDAGGRFAINASTGVVTVADASLLNYEGATSHTVTVRASNASALYSDTGFTIAVTNVAPGSASDSDAGSNTIAENASNGTEVGVTAAATDVHSGTIAYSLADDASGRFAIHASTGVVTVADGTLLDHESADTHTITVRASDASGFYSDTDFTIAVTDADTLTSSGNGSQTLTGTARDDVIDAGQGKDVMIGLEGDDTYHVDSQRDQVIESAGQGHDQVIAAASYTLAANVEDLTLMGSRAREGTGNALDNIIIGNAWANMLTGGLGADTLTGGAERDRFIYLSAADSVATPGGWDTITDFNAGEGDKISLRAIDADDVRAGNQTFRLIGSAAFSTTDATGQLRFDSSTHMLYASTDADDSAEFAIELTGVTLLAAGDLML